MPIETAYGTVPIGWFGVNRDDKMIHYFSRLGLPEELALVTFRLFLEAPVIRKEVVGQHFREFDVDADGRISSVEFDAYIDRVAEGVEAV